MTAWTATDAATFRPGHRPVPEPQMTAAHAASVLAESGFDPDQARAMVAGYLDDTSRELGVSVHQWGLDDADLDHIVARHDAHQHREHEHDDQQGHTASDTDGETADGMEEGWGQ